jgi:hypothetical protein
MFMGGMTESWLKLLIGSDNFVSAVDISNSGGERRIFLMVPLWTRQRYDTEILDNDSTNQSVAEGNFSLMLLP